MIHSLPSGASKIPAKPETSLKEAPGENAEKITAVVKQKLESSFPYSIASKAQAGPSSLFGPPFLANFNSPFTYSTVNDFGRKIHTLFLSSKEREMNLHFSDNMMKIAGEEGLQLQPSEQVHYFVRDVKFSNAQNRILESISTENGGPALSRLIARSELLKNSAASISKHPHFCRITLGRIATTKGLNEYSRDGLPFYQRNKPSRLYLEGGNGFHLTNAQGKRYFIFGEDLLTMTHQILRADGWFKIPEDASTDQNLPAQRLEQKFACYPSQLKDWHANGKIPQLVQKIATEIGSTLKDSDVKKVLDEMQVMGLVKNVRFESEADKRQGRTIVANYLAQREFVKTTVFPLELECGSEDCILFLPQAAYHLDLMMAPGPEGSIFVQDYDLTMKTIEYILGNVERFQLSSEDKEELLLFKESSDKVRKELTPLLLKIRTQLTKAGFVVIPAPGVFLKDEVQVNFLNCITGFSPKTKHYYYITSGAQTKGKLGQAFMDVYREFLQHHYPHIEPHFIGYNPDNPQDFSEATRSSSELSGPHCSSYELVTSPHTHQ